MKNVFLITNSESSLNFAYDRYSKRAFYCILIFFDLFQSSKILAKNEIFLTLENARLEYKHGQNGQKQADLSSFITLNCPKPKTPIFNYSNVGTILKQLKSTSTGPDGLSPKLLKSARLELIPVIVELGNMTINNTHIPTQHKQSNITPIPKVPNPISSKDFRPISNLSVLDKVYQRVIAKFIIKITKNVWIDNEQYGFLPNKCTMDALVQVIDDWNNAKDKHQQILAIFFDFEKAFDLVDHIILLMKLQKYLPQWLISWLAAYLTERQQRVKVGNILTEWLKVQAGVIQGSVIGPILFILFIADINSYLPTGVNIKKYADDILAYLIGKYDTNLPQAIVDGINKWCIENKMRLNSTKCKILPISSKNSITPPVISLNGSVLEEVTTYKYLGINLNINLNWDSQWDRVQSITKSFPFLLRKLKKSGFRGPILANAYRSYALSHFTYSAPVLTSVSEKAKNEINNFHSRILKILKLTPEEAENKYKITNIFVSIDTACLNLLIKILSETTHPLTMKLSVNLRATSINKKYIAPRANTEAYSNTFLQKYLRHLRDGCINLYLPRSIKNYNTIINNNCSQLIKPITTKIIFIKSIQQSEQIACPQCNKLFKTNNGLLTHQRFSKKCNTTISTEIINSNNITFRRKQ